MCPLIDLRQLHWHALIAFSHGIYISNNFKPSQGNASWKMLFIIAASANILAALQTIVILKLGRH